MSLEQHRFELGQSTYIWIFFPIDPCPSTDHSSINRHGSSDPNCSNLCNLRVISMVGSPRTWQADYSHMWIFYCVGDWDPNPWVIQGSTIFDFGIEEGPKFWQRLGVRAENWKTFQVDRQVEQKRKKEKQKLIGSGLFAQRTEYVMWF